MHRPLSLPALVLSAGLALPAGPARAQDAPASAAASPPTLRFDGVYASETTADGDKGGDKYCEYLRFYPRGVVITVTSECGADARQSIRKWFTPAHAGPRESGVSRGRVRVDGDRISFSATSKEGKVAYQGRIDGERLRLETHSFINGARHRETYAFTPW